MENKKKPGRPKKSVEEKKKVTSKKSVSTKVKDVKPVKLTQKEENEIKEIATGKTLENNNVYNSLISKENIIEEVPQTFQEPLKEKEVTEENDNSFKEEKKDESKHSIKKISRNIGNYNFTSIWNGVEIDSY